MLRHLTTACLLAAALPSQDFTELTTKLAAQPGYHDSMVGHAGVESDIFKLYKAWRAAATEQGLLDATEHASAVLRCYAVRGLTEVEAEVDYAAIMRARLTDTDTVMTFCGCCLAKRSVGDVVFELLRTHVPAEQLQDLAETLVTSNSPLDARNWVLRELRLHDRMLHAVRRLAQRGDRTAAVALARYQLRVDLPVIRRMLGDDPFRDDDAFRAAEAFPDPSLLPLLTRHDSEARHLLGIRSAMSLRPWIKAIAAQQSEAAADYLLELLQTVDVSASRKSLLKWAYKRAFQLYPDCKHFDELRELV